MTKIYCPIYRKLMECPCEDEIECEDEEESSLEVPQRINSSTIEITLLTRL